MKKLSVVFISAFLSVLMLLSTVAKAAPNADVPQNVKSSGLELTAKSSVLMDANSKTVVFEKNKDQKSQIASMTKIMTLLLIFDDVKTNKLSLSDDVQVGENAKGMGGSQVFLDVGTYKADSLIKAIIVSSANDASVAMAEHLDGSVESFVARMNSKAKELKMNNTNFANPTGLPNPSGYSSANDVAIMLCELLKNSEYFNYSRIWMDKINHPDGRITEISNTNKLLKSLQGCDGGKTGFTSEARHCVAVTAIRNGTRLISVIVGGVDSKMRFNEAAAVINYGFANFESKKLVDKSKPLDTKLPIISGKVKEIEVAPKEDFYAFGKKKQEAIEKIEYIFNSRVVAPLAVNDEVGMIKVYKNNELIKEIPIIATISVERKTIFDIFKGLFYRD